MSREDEIVIKSAAPMLNPAVASDVEWTLSYERPKALEEKK